MSVVPADDDLPGQVQTQACTFPDRLGREERFEDVSTDVVWDSWSGIAEFNPGVVVFVSGAYGQNTDARICCTSGAVWM